VSFAILFWLNKTLRAIELVADSRGAKQKKINQKEQRKENKSKRTKKRK
jgi:hypothetical protein